MDWDNERSNAKMHFTSFTKSLPKPDHDLRQDAHEPEI